MAPIRPLITARREKWLPCPQRPFHLGTWTPASHPSLLESHRQDPVRSHHHWEVLLGFPLAQSPYFLSGDTLIPTTFPPLLSGLEVPRAQGKAGACKGWLREQRPGPREALQHTPGTWEDRAPAGVLVPLSLYLMVQPQASLSLGLKLLHG